MGLARMAGCKAGYVIGSKGAGKPYGKVGGNAGGKACGKAGGTSGGGSMAAIRDKKSKASGETPPPLDALAIQQIQGYLAQFGGSAPLGKLTSEYPGLKKAQLEQAHFQVVMTPGQADHMVFLTGSSGGSVMRQMGHGIASASSQPKQSKAKRPRDDHAPPEPLTEDQLKDIQMFLQECGGSVGLGKLTTEFEGVKKVQLEAAGLYITSADTGDYTVSLDPNGISTFDPYGMPPAKKAKKEKKDRRGKDPNEPPPPDLELESVQKITEYLESCGGSQTLGKLTSVFEGTKKIQLAPHFELTQNPDNGDCTISLHGVDATPPATSQGSALDSTIDTNKGGGAASKKKKRHAEKDPNAPPPPDLTPAQVADLQDHLVSCGGVTSLGHLTTVFSGLKKVQLEATPFVICGDPARNVFVCLDREAAVAKGLNPM